MSVLGGQYVEYQRSRTARAGRCSNEARLATEGALIGVLLSTVIRKDDSRTRALAYDRYIVSCDRLVQTRQGVTGPPRVSVIQSLDVQGERVFVEYQKARNRTTQEPCMPRQDVLLVEPRQPAPDRARVRTYFCVCSTNVISTFQAYSI